jgi:hypothetical protein
MQPGERRLFIYYRLADKDLHAACAAIRDAQRQLSGAHAGLAAELLCAPEADTAGQRTVMETYARDARVSAKGIDTELQAAIEAALCAALQPWLAPAARHLEVFGDAPCAS